MKFRFCGDLDCPDWVLAEISTLSKMSSVRIKVLVVQILSFCLEGEFNYEKVLKLAADNADGVSDIKGGIAAIHFMLTNAAKHDLDEKSLIQEIQQLGLPKENSDAIAKQYREHKDSLRSKFAEESYRTSRLLSTEWRVDQVLASSKALREPLDSNLPASVIHLKLAVDTMPECGALRADNRTKRVKELAFELSSEKLNVLIHELTQAQKLLENMDN